MAMVAALHQGGNIVLECHNCLSILVRLLQVRPLLAATRNDDELRKKDAELGLIRERAERDQREREALESLKMRLEQDKRKVEDDLEAERSLGIDKDALLERSKKREGELEDDVQALQADIDTLDSHLDRALKVARQNPATTIKPGAHVVYRGANGKHGQALTSKGLKAVTAYFAAHGLTVPLWLSDRTAAVAEYEAGNAKAVAGNKQLGKVNTTQASV